MKDTLLAGAGAGLASLAVGLLLGLAMLRRARTGRSWEEWMAAEPIGGRWAPVVSVVSGAGTVVALYGFGAPPWLRAALLGGLVGWCVPFLVEGVRRKLLSPRAADGR